MYSFKCSNFVVVAALALLCGMNAPDVGAQDCQQNREVCNATQVLADFPLYGLMLTSDRKPPTYCDRFERTSLSSDGTSAEYNVIYTHPGDTTPISGTCTYNAVNNTFIGITCANYPSAVSELTLDYIKGDECFIGHSNINEDTGIQTYWLLSNVYINISEYKKCLDEFYVYSGGNVTATRDTLTCQNIRLRPEQEAARNASSKAA